MIRIAIDIMGGDHAPQAIVEGCVEALSLQADIYLDLCGPTAQIESLLNGKSYNQARISIVEAPDVISNHDSPTLAIRRKLESSMVVAMDRVKNGDSQAFVSAGSTGAILAGGVFRVGRIKGIERPALAPVLPTLTGVPAMLLDSGANADCRPEYLSQFAIMGESYMKGVMGIERPKVGLLNVGAEEEKGNELSKAAFPLLKELPIDFYGNIEARDALSGEVQVIVADGFSGNILLKSIEGTVSMIFSLLKESMSDGLRAKLGAALVYPKLRAMKHKLDYQEYGGAVLLGTKGVMIKAHGSSSPHAFACAIRQAATCVKGDVVNTITQRLS